MVRLDNHHFIMNVDQSFWGHNIANAKTYTEQEALDRVDEIESSDFKYRVHASPLKKEMAWYKENYK
ncbi:hypothetical protein [Metabacillus idriensis]|uniref:hypothetical protein n=1 Tax=Metabacillus idriensis TaxID=324768 RepID=UPI00174916EE|nr:hypothetical protein [Metabacillus idriensis]